MKKPSRRLTEARVSNALQRHTLRSAEGLAATLSAWGTAHVLPVRFRANLALVVAVLALIVAVVGVFV